MENDWKRNKKMKDTPGCLGEYDWQGEFDCGYEDAPICEDCIYGPLGGVAGCIDPETGIKI
ncbi:MAG: hypothetical protein OEL55_04420 [Desulfobulbaceae bacterium]|nr:hypothetical protein [Desulfobulbaceae bacterium]